MYLLDDETQILRAPGGAVVRTQWFKDEDPTPPWDDCGAVPVALYRYQDTLDLEGTRGFDLLDPLAYLSDSKIKANLHKIAGDFAPFGMWNPNGLYSNAQTFDAFVTEEYCERDGFTLRNGRREFLRDILRDASRNRDFLEFVASLWTIAGVPASVITSCGYCQGDVVEILAVAHPEAVAEWGFTRKDGKPNFAKYRKTCPNDLTKAADSVGAWLWGGVVGYVIEQIDADDAEDIDEDPNGPEGKHLGSCWGFYPDNGPDAFDLKESHAYALDEAENEARDHLDSLANENAETVAAEIAASRPDLCPVSVGALA